jgi:hypothetical protein
MPLRQSGIEFRNWPLRRRQLRVATTRVGNTLWTASISSSLTGCQPRCSAHSGWQNWAASVPTNSCTIATKQVSSASNVTAGPVLDALDYKQLIWPWHSVGDNQLFQYLDCEYMKADQYDEFIIDPTGFYSRK